MYNPQERRTSILMAALEVFSRDGFYKAKVSDIAKTANIGKGTIYEYFDSKKNLFEEMVKFCIEGYSKEAKSFMGETVSPLKKLKNFIIFEKEIMIKYGNIASIFLHEGDKIGKEAKNIIIGFRDKKLYYIEAIIKEGIEKKVFKDVNSRIVALTFMGAAHQVIADKLLICMGNEEKFNELDIDDFLNIFINGIAA